MAANTTLLKLLKPTVSGDADVWGGYLNTNFDSLDKLLSSITTTGSGAAYVLTSGQSLSAYAAGQAFLIKASFTCNATATLNVDGLGAKAITKYGTTATVSGDVISGNIYHVVYDGTQFQIAGGYSDATITALAALSWSSGNALVQFTAADTVSLTNSPTLTGGTYNLSTFTYLLVKDSAATNGQTGIQIQSKNGAGTARNHYLFGGGDTLALQVDTGNFNISGAAGISLNVRPTFNSNTALDTNNGAALAGATFTGDVQRPTSTTTPVAASVGYIGTIIRAKDATYTIVANDAGYTLYHTSASAHTFTIDSNANLALPVGFMFKVRNDNGAGVVTVAITTDTLRWGASTGSRSIAANGSATFTKQSSTSWFVEGAGIT